MAGLGDARRGDGGDAARRGEGGRDRPVFVKRAAGARAEAAGLTWLREASDSVAEVAYVQDSTIATVRYDETRPSQEAPRRAGRELWRIHEAGAPAFGAPPEGFSGQNYLGRLPLECTPQEDWMEFYAVQRVLPFVKLAVDNGNLDRQGAESVEKHLARAVWDAHPPARIHGDLWAGNLLFSTVGPIFIDPAAHGGDPVTDLAMLDLFGAHYLDDIFAAYEEAAGWDTSWRELIPLHQLHPLAVHAATHGPSYARELVRIAAKV